jgi:membrane-bound lytic murein transglycosylase B
MRHDNSASLRTLLLMPKSSLSFAARFAAVATLMLLASCAIAAKPAKKARAVPVQAIVDDSAPDVVTYGARDDVMRFADELAERQGLDAQWVRDKLAEARFVPSVARFIQPPPAGTAKNWAAYRARFVEPQRIRAGLAFWRDNEAWLAKAEALYGVPAAIVVGIVGVETVYGQQMGGFRVVDALATLAFDFPSGRKDRSDYFRNELEQLFVFAKKDDIDPLALKGSYAGAMGMPQFMPSSTNRWAVDFDNDGRIDLQRDAADVIGSVAHFLAEHGWASGLATHFPVAAPVEVVERATLLVPDIVPSFSVEQMAAHGALLGPLPEGFDGELALIELQNGDAAPSYVAGTHNFYVLTRYNWSSYYAMAVIELGAAIARERGR